MFSVSFHSVHFSHSASVRYYDKVEEKEDFWQTGRCFNESRFFPLFSLKTISSSIPLLKILLFYMLWPLQTMRAVDLEYNLKRKKTVSYLFWENCDVLVERLRRANVAARHRRVSRRARRQLALLEDQSQQRKQRMTENKIKETISCNVDWK
jgi:hypothetical protein